MVDSAANYLMSPTNLQCLMGLSSPRWWPLCCWYWHIYISVIIPVF